MAINMALLTELKAWISWGLPITAALASLPGEMQTRMHRVCREQPLDLAVILHLAFWCNDI
jgi:hypothetical protein